MRSSNRKSASSLKNWVNQSIKPVLMVFNLRPVEWVLVGMVGFALVARIIGINFGLPNLYNPDESLIMNPAIGLIKSSLLSGGFIDPLQFSNPSLYRFIQWIGAVLTYVLNTRSGILNSAAIPSDQYWLFYLIGRWITALLGTACIPLLYRIGKDLYAEKVGLTAAGMFTVFALHVEFSHYIQADVPALFLILLSFWFAIQVMRQGRWSDYILAGISVGLATATQYRSLTALIFMLAAHGLRKRKNEPGAGRFLTYGILATGVSFLIACPYLLLNLPLYMKSLSAQVVGLRVGQPSLGVWLQFARVTLVEKIGYTSLALSLAGIILLFFKMDRNKVLLLSFPIVYLVALPLFGSDVERDLLALTPFLALTAASFLVFAASWLTEKVTGVSHQRIMAGVIWGLFVSMALFEPVWRSIQVDSFLSSKNGQTQVKAAAWIRENIPAANGIVEESFAPSLPDYQKSFFTWAVGADLGEGLKDYVSGGYSIVILTDWKVKQSDYFNNNNAPVRQELIKQAQLLTQFTSKTRNAPTISVYQIAPYLKSGDVLFSDDFNDPMLTKWVVYDGAWQVKDGSLQALGSVDVVNLFPNPDLVDGNGDGVPDGWRVVHTPALSLADGILKVTTSGMTDAIDSPEIKMPPRNYHCSLEIKATIINPRLNIQYDIYDRNNQLLQGYKVLDRFDKSVDWQKKFYNFNLSLLPGSAYIRLVFLWSSVQ